MKLDNIGKHHVIEAPTNSQKRDALISHSANMLASGRSKERVFEELKKRGMSMTDIEASWDEIQNRGSECIRARCRKVRTMGLCWFFLGILMLGGMVWCLVFYGAIPFILVIGAIPLAYGIYLLRLAPTKDPSIDPPRIFGRDL